MTKQKQLIYIVVSILALCFILSTKSQVLIPLALRVGSRLVLVLTLLFTGLYTYMTRQQIIREREVRELKELEENQLPNAGDFDPKVIESMTKYGAKMQEQVEKNKHYKH
jgi:hypothetical protein